MEATMIDGEKLRCDLQQFISESVRANGGDTSAIKPGNRIKFSWPPHPVSYEFHVLSSDWKGRATFEAHGETFEVEVAQTPFGVFGRCQEIWHEARGESLEEMLEELRKSSEPLFQRQFLINKGLGKPGRFVGHVRELPAEGLLHLLYSEDRDIANEAKIAIELHPHRREMMPGLLLILEDCQHPLRRSAQWCVLDLFEDLPSFTRHQDDELAAVKAIRNLIWDAEDDYARTIYKAGVVLGGHIPNLQGGPTLIECLDAPSKVGRRSAIHGLYHVVEWMPDMKQSVLNALQNKVDSETDPLLKQYAIEMREDIAKGTDHRPEPVFDFER